MRSDPRLPIFLWLCSTLSCPAAAQTPNPRQTFNTAVAHYNAGRHDDAKRALTRLVAEHPTYFAAYGLYWDAVGKTEDAAAQQAAARSSLAVLREVGIEERTESFYYAVMDGERLIGETERAEQWRLEAIGRLPRSKIMQQDRLDRAKREPDPVKACALWREFIADFPDNVSWCQGAARRRFERMLAHADRFSDDEIIAAAASLDGLTAAFIVKYGNPTRQLLSRHHIASELLVVDPRQSIAYAKSGREFVDETAAETREFDASAAAMFAQVELLAHARLEQWPDAAATGDELFPVNDRSQPTGAPHGSRYAEADLRQMHGRALLRVGRTDEAREQLAYAAHLRPELRDELEQVLREHPLTAIERAALDAKTTAFELDRTARRKASLLRTEESRPAPAFSLLDLAGKRVSLEDFRGRVVVLSFWATWCAPCVRELDELAEFHERLTADRSVAVVAVNIDTDKAAVPPFVEQRDYPFRVLLSDGTVEEPYQTRPIPKLYVIDRKGRIRFDRTGYDVHHFEESLRWMIEAAQR